MANDQLLGILEEIGLNENEAKVYLAALNLGSTTVLKLAQAAEIKRPTVYTVVESLKQKGLMAIEVKGFKKKYVAEDPKKLEAVLDAKKKKFATLLPQFSTLYNLDGSAGAIKYYEGLEAIKGVYENLIRDVRRGEDYLVLSNVEEWVSHDKEHFTEFLYRRAQLPIKIRMLWQDSSLAREWKGLERNFNAEIRILPETTKLKTNLVITPQRVFIHQITLPLVGILIENKSVIEMHKEMYEIIWSASREN